MYAIRSYYGLCLQWLALLLKSPPGTELLIERNRVNAEKNFFIRRSFLLPLGLLLGLAGSLFVVCLLKGEPTAKVLILVFLRITSYNVCYTKLLRLIVSHGAEQVRFVALRADHLEAVIANREHIRRKARRDLPEFASAEHPRAAARRKLQQVIARRRFLV